MIFENYDFTSLHNERLNHTPYLLWLPSIEHQSIYNNILLKKRN